MHLMPEVESPRSDPGGDENTFQLDEDTLPDLSRADAAALKIKNKRRRRKRLSESHSLPPKFSDCYNMNKQEFLGGGSYGSVYLCSQRRNNSEEYAVKIIEKAGHSRTRLFNEIEILHQCKGHPNIIQLVDFIEEEERFFLIFEKMNGGPLLDHIAERGFFSEREASLVVRDIAIALKFLHQRGIAHRDLKPANILCTYRDSANPVKICDFDLASAPWSHGSPSSSGNGSGIFGSCNGSVDCAPMSPELNSPVGSAEYMAPEVVSLFIEGHAAAYDKRCDMWSLGVIMYIMLCGSPPFEGHCGKECRWAEGGACQECQDLLMGAIQRGTLSFPDRSWSHVSEEAKHLLRHLLERNADKRFTASDVLAHSWLQPDTSTALRDIQLNTPGVFKRTNSAVYMSGIADQLVATNRVMGQACVFTETHERPRLNTEDSGIGTEPGGTSMRSPGDEFDVDDFPRSVVFTLGEEGEGGGDRGHSGTLVPGESAGSDNEVGSEAEDSVTPQFRFSEDEENMPERSNILPPPESLDPGFPISIITDQAALCPSRSRPGTDPILGGGPDRPKDLKLVNRGEHVNSSTSGLLGVCVASPARPIRPLSH